MDSTVSPTSLPSASIDPTLAHSPEARLQQTLVDPTGLSQVASGKASASVSVSQALLERFMASPWVGAMVNRLCLVDAPQDVILDNLANPSVKWLVVASVFQHSRRPVVLLSPDPHVSEKIADELAQYLLPDQVELYPTEDVSPYDLSIPSVRSLKSHYRILNRLANNERFVLILSPKSLLLKHPSLATINRDTLTLRVGDEFGALANDCLALGYTASSLIMAPGEFSSRGDIFDLYPVNEAPVRIEFFGDVIETIRLIDIENQRSVGTVKQVTVIPKSTIALTPTNRASLPQRLMACLQQQKPQLTEIEYEGLDSTLQNQCQALTDQGPLSFWPDGIDYYAPLTCNTPDVDFLPLADCFTGDQTPILIVDDWAMLTNNISALSDRLERQASEGIEKGRLLDLGFLYHVPHTQALGQLKERLPNRLFLDTYPLT
jgi:transcription-repair coupling factor (superfamily II helicase)